MEKCPMVDDKVRADFGALASAAYCWVKIRRKFVWTMSQALEAALLCVVLISVHSLPILMNGQPMEMMYIDGPHDMFLPALDTEGPESAWSWFDQTQSSHPVAQKRNIAIGRGDGFRPGK
ncbi:unnamed protein product [Bursaphelenchus xylophilus]|uniref:(pine wood nematode) hypothetical protein n=1 Tax=Bursaphelenchus xylophilus TaxID=6326 RepID=A0A1I7RX28_BURXY|nr:unnamed protein product [Bursaphelenchus xylophilus]CAG9121286.1 unnamed protein product [Bursaphelenchus xylophilus]